LLTDREAGDLNGATVQRLAQRGPVRSLRGLHGKVYIVDDLVLLTSANLTRTAFSKRYEVGVWLRGSLALEAIKQYEKWWEDIRSGQLKPEDLAQIVKNRRADAGEDEGSPLVVLNSLPNDPGDFGGSKLVKLFIDYRRFLDDYKTLAQEYAAVQRIWPKVPLYFEVDGFLNYLFRDHPKCPSKRFEEDKPRQLSKEARTLEIRRLARGFKDWANQNDDGRWRLRRSRLVRKRLSKRNIDAIKKNQIREVVECLHCMNDRRRRNRFLNNPKNTTIAVRRAWADLLYGTQPDTERMSLCASRLFGFKKSSVQELLGFFAPKDYPLRNATVNAGLRFFGFDVKPH
jgi:hypothetical protein